MVEQKLSIGGRLLRFGLLSLEVLLHVVLLLVYVLLRRLTVHACQRFSRSTALHGQKVAALHWYLLGLLLLRFSLATLTDAHLVLVVVPLLLALRQDLAGKLVVDFQGLGLLAFARVRHVRVIGTAGLLSSLALL